MATETPPVVLPDEKRRMIDESFHQALESIKRIHAPLQLADRVKANRLGKISYDLAQLQRDAHMDGTISLLAPTGTDLGMMEQMSPALASEPLTAPQYDREQALQARPSHSSESQDEKQKAEAKQAEKPTWAEIAASAGSSKKGHKLSDSEIAALEGSAQGIICMTPRKGHKYSDSQIAAIEEHTGSIAYISVLLEQRWNEGEEAERRVVEVLRLPKTYTLRQLTCRIREGPLICVRLLDEYGKNTKKATVYFMKAENAKSFFLKNEMVRGESGDDRSLYGPGTHVVWGSPYRDPDGVLSMQGQCGARRRLTFVGRQMFTKIRPAQFGLDIVEAVGKENVELVWVFNKGNATVVLNDIRTAYALKEWFDEQACEPGPYQGITVAFSADFCESNVPLAMQLSQGSAVEL